MSKLVYSEDFKLRFNNAAKNGSKVCAAIMKAINTPDNVKAGVRFNYLTTKRVRHGSNENFVKKSVVVTMCNKDFSNENNPEHGSPVGMWRPENRVSLSLTDLVGAFKSLDGNTFTSDDYKYASSILCVDEPLKVAVYSKMQDIERGYLGTNYVEVYSGDGTLQNSCMRGEDTARVAADFYANFAGARIILATGTVTGRVYGRAMLWPHIEMENNEGELVEGQFLERVYYAHDAIMDMIRSYAKSIGVRFRKYRNTYCDKDSFVDMTNDEVITARVCIKVPAKKWHKEGSPYVDTFSYLYYVDGGFVLANNSWAFNMPFVADLATTGTVAYHNGNICPVCGKVHTTGNEICSSCRSAYTKSTPVGRIWIGKTDKNHNPILPKKYVQDIARLNRI
jgi:hypothetical protein